MNKSVNPSKGRKLLLRKSYSSRSRRNRRRAAKIKLSSDLKTLKAKATSIEGSIKHTLQQLNEIKNQECISEQSLISQSQESSHQDPLPQLSTVIAESNECTYTVAASNRYEMLVEENRSIVKSIPSNKQPIPS